MDGLRAVFQYNPTALTLNNMFGPSVLPFLQALFSNLKECASVDRSDPASYKNYDKWPMALFFERWAKIIAIEATTGQALQSINSTIALPSFRVGGGGFTESSMQSFFETKIFPMLATHEAELALLDIAQWKTFTKAIVTNAFVEFNNAKTIRGNFLICLDESFQARGEGGDPYTLMDFHVLVMKEIHRLKEAKAFVSGYEAPHVEDKVRAPSNTLAAFQQPTEKERGDRGNLSERCYGCHRRGHSGDGCFRKRRGWFQHK